MSIRGSARQDNRAQGSDRNFGLVVGGILCAIGLYPLLIGSGIRLMILVPGVLLVVFGVVAPKLLHPLNVAWTALGELLSRIFTPLVMAALYVTVIVPMGLVLRLSGKDLLSLKRRAQGSSYWIERAPPGPPPESLKDQF
jgi:hypothetical protein